MSKLKKECLVSKKHQDLEIELIINKSLYKKELITKDMFIQAQDIILKLIAEEKSKFNDLRFSKNSGNFTSEVSY